MTNEEITIEFLRKEDKEIRGTINADENESTFDEVVRLKSRHDKMAELLEDIQASGDTVLLTGQWRRIKIILDSINKTA